MARNFYPLRTYSITETETPKGGLYQAQGFLSGKSYRGLPTSKHPRSDALRLMTRSPNALHPGEWPAAAFEDRALGATGLCRF